MSWSTVGRSQRILTLSLEVGHEVECIFAAVWVLVYKVAATCLVNRGVINAKL